LAKYAPTHGADVAAETVISHHGKLEMLITTNLLTIVVYTDNTAAPIFTIT
jgi:hypothetical protein